MSPVSRLEFPSPPPPVERVRTMPSFDLVGPLSGEGKGSEEAVSTQPSTPEQSIRSVPSEDPVLLSI